MRAPPKSIAIAAFAGALLLSAGWLGCRQAPVETPATEEPGQAVIYPEGAQAEKDITAALGQGGEGKEARADRLRRQLVWRLPSARNLLSRPRQSRPAGTELRAGPGQYRPLRRKYGHCRQVWRSRVQRSARAGGARCR